MRGMGAVRTYHRLTAAEFRAVAGRPEDASALMLQQVRAKDPKLVCELDKLWIELDVILDRAGFGVAEVNGTTYLYEPDSTASWPIPVSDDFWQEGDRLRSGPPVRLSPDEVRNVSARLSALDVPAAFDAVPTEVWDEYFDGEPLDPENRDYFIELLEAVVAFFAATAAGGDFVVTRTG